MTRTARRAGTKTVVIPGTASKKNQKKLKNLLVVLRRLFEGRLVV